MQTLTAPPPYQWTREAYERAVAAGVFEGEPVELIGGRIVRMTPTGPEHTYFTIGARETLERVFSAADVYVREEKSLALGECDEPQPDLAVVAGDRHRYARRHPTAAEALLVVEVAVTTRDYDLGDKADIYAAAGLAAYWAICPGQAEVVVCRTPRMDSRSKLTGWRYAERRVYRPGETIAPLADPSLAIPVAVLLPPLPDE
jgi:Uma2 family endonuclease